MLTKHFFTLLLPGGKITHFEFLEKSFLQNIMKMFGSFWAIKDFLIFGSVQNIVGSYDCLWTILGYDYQKSIKNYRTLSNHWNRIKSEKIYG